LKPSFCCPWRQAAAPGGWLLPSFCCPWRLAAALVLLPLAAGFCPRSAPSGCLLPSFCCGWLLLWRLAAAPCGWLLPLFRMLPGGWLLPSFCCPWLLAGAPGGPAAAPRSAAPWRPGCCSGGWLIPLAAGCCPRSATPGGCLLPSFCCLWRLAAALVLLPLAAGCCPRSAAPGGWLLRLAVALVLLPLADGCCPRSAAPGGWLLPSFCCPWRLVAALVLPLAFQSQTLIEIPASVK